MAVQGAIFDIDGTLVLSNDANALAWVESFAAFGYEVQYEQVRPLIGMGGDKIIPRFAPGLSDKEGTGKEIASRRKELMLEKFAPDLVAAPGARQLVERLQKEGLRLIIASSATSQELSVLLKVAKVDDLLNQDEAVTSSDAEASKPEPDLVKVALSRIQMPPESVVMIGDSPYDIETAKKAGVGTIAFRCGGYDDAQLQGAIAIYDNPAALVEQYDRSPIAKEAAIGT